MAAEDLPSEFDVVIVGTGLTESVVAAACSRAGQRVLHLDTRSYYASGWASFTFNALVSWIDERQSQEERSPDDRARNRAGLLREGEEPIPLRDADATSVRNLRVFCFASQDEEEEEEEELQQEEKPCAESTEPTAHVRQIEEESPAESPEPSADDGPREDERAPADGHATESADGSEVGGKKPNGALSGRATEGGDGSELGGKKLTYAYLLKEGRRFNIDLTSKLMYARGSLVDLLIKSNVSRYAEFKNVTRILTYRDGAVEQVPCSRADVFASRRLSVVEKRKLMRFLTSCLEEKEEEPKADVGRTYSEYLRERQLGDNLRHFLLHSIAMATEDTPAPVGLASTRRFLRCLGRYGNTPFLFPVYGLGEIPQCFCRMCAVFGGVYCLRHPVDCLLLDKSADRCTALIDGRGRRIAGGHFVLEDGFLPERASAGKSVSRGVLITDRSILPGDRHQVSLVTVPPAEAGLPAVRMVELSPSTMTCAPGTYLVHLTCPSQLGSAYEDLSPVVSGMFRSVCSPERDSRPGILWAFYFNADDGGSEETDAEGSPSNVYVCSGPDGELGHERAIKRAEAIFRKIVPDQDFCPPAPNPEDILYDAGEDVEAADQQLQVEE
ncbi:rab proteins geranylgeranyltransferase component A 1 [Corythoichthys intestinalis]|uniref:rab proteins geranylgeranyltransferase component A 1 n=1 Tax=Corythoichthys intestinalis TaxID=161448 RepID=UPI0025A5948C|nr:rab proteins geranylgeranyltransferase component A 1 [Corythoichthys intestinalis]XP_061801118.1 rab proteins geranylgeranyltransferase component A 1-like [Nerophis lumbriciformis]